MLRAIASDFARIPGCQVVTTLDVHRPSLEVAGVREIRVSSPDEEQQVFLNLVASSDACLVIAPELEDALTRRCQMVESASGARLLNSQAHVTHWCSDKLALARMLEGWQIPTIATGTLREARQVDALEGAVVVKTRFGAGSQGIRTFDALDEAMAAYSGEALQDDDSLIVQPLVRGIAASVGVIVPSNGEGCDVLPVALQHLADDGTFVYQGGTVPWGVASKDMMQKLVEQVCGELQGLRGYVGLDMILPFDNPECPLIVEINPRLTTSYLGYRQLTDENLAWRMLIDRRTSPISWKARRVSYTPDGDFQILDELPATSPLSPAPHC